MKLTVLVIVTLALGTVLGLALRGTVFEAEAAKPPAPTVEGRTVLVAQNVNLGPGESHTTALEETADCRDMRLMVDHTGHVAALLLPSPDEASQTGAIDLLRFEFDGNSFYTPRAGQDGLPFSATAPKVAVRLSESTGSVAATVNGAWLYCSR